MKTSVLRLNPSVALVCNSNFSLLFALFVLESTTSHDTIARKQLALVFVYFLSLSLELRLQYGFSLRLSIMFLRIS